MRIDKFLKVSGLVRRRRLAKEACEEGLVLLNGSPVKPSREVKPGDILEIRIPGREMRLRVLDVRGGRFELL